MEKNYTTAALAQAIAAGRERSLKDNGGLLNNEIDAALLYKLFEHLNPAAIFARYSAQEFLSMRAWLNTLRVAKSIADFDGVAVNELSIHEAMQYRFVKKMVEARQQHAA